LPRGLQLDEIKRNQAAKEELRIAQAGIEAGGRGAAPAAPPPELPAHVSPLRANAASRQQQQQVQEPATGPKRRQHDGAGPSGVRAADAPARPPAPLLSAPALAAVRAAASGAGALMAHLWSGCPDSMSLLMGCAPGPAADPQPQPDAASAHVVAAFSRRLPRVASGAEPAVGLFDHLAAAVARGCAEEERAAAGADGRQLPVLGAALRVMGRLLREDAGCRQAALASCGCAAPAAPPQASPRVAFRVPPPAPALPAAPPALPQLRAATAPDRGGGAGQGVASLAARAALLLGPRHPAVFAGALEVAAALAAAAAPGAQRGALLPLLDTGAAAAFLQEPALRLPAVQLVHSLLEDPALAAAVGAGAAAALARAEQPGGGSPGPASAAKRRAGGGTPLTRGAAARMAAGDRVPMDIDPPAPAPQGAWLEGWAVLEGLAACLAPPPPGPPAEAVDDCALPRAALAAVALLRERGQQACLGYLLQEAGTSGTSGGGGPLPVALLALAESAVAHQGADAPVTPVMTAAWPQGAWPAARDARAGWQRRLRVAQEALTLLRGLLLTEATGGATVDELLPGAAVTRRVLAAATRLSKATGPAEGEAAGALVPALPLAAWARAIGSSSAAPGVGAAGAERGGLPCCSAQDVAYMASRLRARLLMPYGA
jgi:hypothetical protein